MTPEYRDLTYQRDGFEIVVTNVPMSVCTHCGESYVPGPIAEALSDVVAEAVEAIEREAMAHPVARPRRLEYEADRALSRSLAYAHG